LSQGKQPLSKWPDTKKEGQLKLPLFRLPPYGR
jgi:hypothetical protein